MILIDLFMYPIVLVNNSLHISLISKSPFEVNKVSSQNDMSVYLYSEILFRRGSVAVGRECKLMLQIAI